MRAGLRISIKDYCRWSFADNRQRVGAWQKLLNWFKMRISINNSSLNCVKEMFNYSMVSLFVSVWNLRHFVAMARRQKSKDAVTFEAITSIVALLLFLWFFSVGFHTGLQILLLPNNQTAGTSPECCGFQAEPRHTQLPTGAVACCWNHTQSALATPPTA